MSSGVSSISNHLLDIDSLNDVYMGIMNFRARWKHIGITLGVKFNTIEAINVDHMTSEDKLMEVIAAWLRRQCEDQIIMPSWRNLCLSLQTVDKTTAEELAKKNECDCPECAVVAKPRCTPVGKAIQNSNVVEAMKALSNEFDDLMVFIGEEINKVKLVQFMVRINSFVIGTEGTTNDTIDEHFKIIDETYTKPSCAFNYLWRHGYVGYINYGLVKACLQVTKSVLLEKRITEYEKDYRLFLECRLKDIHIAFKECPELKPDYLIGLPKFEIHLQSEWEGRKMFEWREVLRKRIGSWPESLIIENITEKCILFKCSVWPRFAKGVIDDLTDDALIEKLKQEGITFQNISPKLLAYKQFARESSMNEEIRKKSVIELEQTKDSLKRLRSENNDSLSKLEEEVIEKDQEILKMKHEMDSMQESLILKLKEKDHVIVSLQKEIDKIKEGPRAGRLEVPIDSEDSEDSDKVTSKGTEHTDVVGNDETDKVSDAVKNKSLSNQGVGVLNNTSFNEMNIGLSIGVPYYFENGIKSGEIYFCRPGPLIFTLYSFPRYQDCSNDIRLGVPGTISHGKCIYPTILDEKTTFSVEKLKLYCQKNNQFVVRGGCWFVIEGGPHIDTDGQYKVQRLTMRKTDLKELMETGHFTAESHVRYHAIEHLQCTKDCQYCN